MSVFRRYVSRRRFLSEAALTLASYAFLRFSRFSRAANFVESLWSGALQPTSARINAKIDHNSTTVRLHISPNPDFSQAILSGFAVADTAVNNRMVSLPITTLQPDTTYYYAIEADGQLDTTTTGQLHTPGIGPYSYTFAFASCARHADDPIFTTIIQQNPLFFLHTGDMYYEGIDENDRDLYRAAYDTILTSPTQSAMYRAMPLMYMWDDNDYGSGDSHKGSHSREAARLSYQEYVPHYPLVAGAGDVPIYQAFTIGRVRYIVTDTRSERNAKSVPADDPSKSMLGVAQKAWFKEQLLAANGLYPIIIWVCTSPWIADLPEANPDTWAGFMAERQELSDFIVANNIKGLYMLSGDVHMLAIDDGSNNNYATNGGPNFPIMQAAALTSSGSDLSGHTYSEGQYAGRGQFGLMTVVDDGSPSIQISWSGRNVDNQEVVAWEDTVNFHKAFLPTVIKP